jgi:Fic family protein
MREYEKTHPWITFRIDLRELDPETWLLLGEAASKCQHVAGVPLRPEVAQKLHEVYLSKGAHGTTSIEGNTLSEQEVLEQVQGTAKPLPSSSKYLQVEVQNVLNAFNVILGDMRAGRPLDLTPERITSFNRLVLDDLDLDEGVKPGGIRRHSVLVGRYRGAPAEECEFLLEELCKWLRKLDEVGERYPHLRFTVAIGKAVMAHLYIAWIHPFGDGNGRTARLMEFQILVQSGVPVPAAHLLSDFYNRTRDVYYRELERTSSETPYRVNRFMHYALQGFVDELITQLGVIREEQMRVTWVNYVHDRFRHKAPTPAQQRQLRLVLALSVKDEPRATKELPLLTPELAMLYAGKTPKTVTRDVNALLNMGLIRREESGVVANTRVIAAFLPEKAGSAVL